MDLLIILTVWLVAPFVELGIIIMLWISNSRYKEKLEEYQGKKQGKVVGNSAEKGGISSEYGTWPVKVAFQNPAGNLRKEQGSEWTQSPAADERNHVNQTTDGDMGKEARPCADTNRQAGMEHGARPCADTNRQSGTGNDARPYFDTSKQAGMGKADLLPQRGKRTAKLVSDIQGNLGTISLIIGVVLVVLSGTIFATTRWQVLSDSSKVFFVLAASILFFIASYMAETVLDISKTGNAFYILGSVFLFLTVTAAAYFQLFGPDFTLDEGSRWKVLWIGSLVMEGALLTGLKRFHDRIYTQASLWGLMVSICFMAKAFGAGWNGLIGSMAWMGVALTIGCLLFDSVQAPGNSTKLVVLIKEELFQFIPAHFLMVCCSLFLSGLETVGAFLAIRQNASLFFPEDEIRKFMLCIGAAAALIILVLFASGTPFYKGCRKQMVSAKLAGIYSMAGIYSLAGAANHPVVFRFAIVSLWFVVIQMFLLLRKRRNGKTEEKHELSAMWELCGFVTLIVGLLCAEGSREWIFGYLLMFACYFLRFANIKKFCPGAGTLSATLLAAAMWEQPFLIWPKEFALEIGLVPAVMLIYVLGLLWGQKGRQDIHLAESNVQAHAKTVRNLQDIGYVSSLVVLSIDAFRTGLLADALMLELVCLIIFIVSQIKGAIGWVRISGACILLVALFMTKEFWFRVSWWVYLLVAGISLIVFAAVNEKRKHKNDPD